MAESGVWGIDVSHYQGAINWEVVARSGVAFAYIKASDGVSGGDSAFRENWAGAKATGLQRGAYHFFRAQADADAQVERLLSFLGSDHGELPPVLDFEVLAGVTVNEGLQRAKRWLESVEEAIGQTPIVYTGTAFWHECLKNSEALAGYPLWIAHYTSAQEPEIPSAWKRWTFWQHSEKGNVAGVTGRSTWIVLTES